MRNLKKLLAVLLALCVILTFTVPAFAADEPKYSSEATKLNTLGLYLGTGNPGGEFVANLGATLTREAGIALVVRLMGKQDDASKMTDEEVNAALKDATDLKDLSSWAKKNMAYAVKAGWYVGTSTTALTLAPKGDLTGKALAAYILRAMGYTVEQTTPEKSIALLVEKSGITADQGTAMADKKFTRDDAVGMMFSSLNAKYSDGTTVIAKLVSTKAVDEQKAVDAGVYTKVTAKALDVSSAVAINSKIVEVTLGTAAVAADLSAAGAVTVKDSAAKDVAVAKVEFAPWATDGKDLLVTLGADTAAGTVYTLTAGTKSTNFGGQAADTTKPTVSKVESTDYNQVTVTFSEPVLLGGTVAFTKSYGDKAALASTTIAYNGSNVITVATADQSAATLYAAAIKGYVDLAGNKMDDDTAKTFVGQAKATDTLQVKAAGSNNPEEAIVKFNLKVDTATIAPANFTVTEAYGTKATLPVTDARIATDSDLSDTGAALDATAAKSYVVLTVPGTKAATLYKVTVANLKSTVGTAMDSTSNNTTFVGTAKPSGVFAINGTVTVNNNTSITVKFANKLDKTLAETIANYAITLNYGTKAALAISKAELQSDGKSVKLTVASMTGDLYKVVASNLKDIWGNALDTANNTTTYVGQAVEAKIDGFTAPAAVVGADNITLTLNFNHKVGTSLTDVSHYFIDGGVGYPTKAVAGADAYKVDLTIPKTTDGKVYTITVKGLENADGVAMDAAGISTTFIGRGNSATMATIQGIAALDYQTIEVFFDRAADDTTLTGILANLTYSSDGGTTYGAFPAGTYTYKDSVNANGLIIRVKPANTFKTVTSGTTFKLKGATTKVTNTAVLDFAPAVAAPTAPSISGVVALDKQTLRVYFSQEIADISTAAATFTVGTFKVYSGEATGDVYTGATKVVVNKIVKVDALTYDLVLNTTLDTSSTKGNGGAAISNGQVYLYIDTAGALDGSSAAATAVYDKTSIVEISKDDSSSKAYESRLFGMSSTAVSADLTDIGLLMTDARTMKVFFPVAMDSTAATNTNNYAVVTSTAGTAAAATVSVPALITYDSATNSATLYFTTDVKDNALSNYYLAIDHDVVSANGTQAVKAEVASGLANNAAASNSGLVRQFAASTTACAAPKVVSATASDDRYSMDIKMDAPVKIAAADANVSGGFTVAGTLTPTEFDAAYSITAQFEGETSANAVVDADIATVAVNAAHDTVTVTFNVKLAAGSTGVAGNKGALANKVTNRQAVVAAVDSTNGVQVTYGVAASLFADTTGPSLLSVAITTDPGADGWDDVNDVLTLTFNENVALGDELGAGKSLAVINDWLYTEILGTEGADTALASGGVPTFDIAASGNKVTVTIKVAALTAPLTSGASLVDVSDLSNIVDIAGNASVANGFVTID